MGIAQHYYQIMIIVAQHGYNTQIF